MPEPLPVRILQEFQLDGSPVRRCVGVVDDGRVVVFDRLANDELVPSALTGPFEISEARAWADQVLGGSTFFLTHHHSLLILAAAVVAMDETRGDD